MPELAALLPRVRESRASDYERQHLAVSMTATTAIANTKCPVTGTGPIARRTPFETGVGLDAKLLRVRGGDARAPTLSRILHDIYGSAPAGDAASELLAAEERARQQRDAAEEMLRRAPSAAQLGPRGDHPPPASSWTRSLRLRGSSSTCVCAP